VNPLFIGYSFIETIMPPAATAKSRKWGRLIKVNLPSYLIFHLVFFCEKAVDITLQSPINR
jgi:hypothetical protein